MFLKQNLSLSTADAWSKEDSMYHFFQMYNK